MFAGFRHSYGLKPRKHGLDENSIRPTSVGRRRWLFIRHPDAGWRSAVIYSVLVSCRHCGINPQEYLISSVGCPGRRPATFRILCQAIGSRPKTTPVEERRFSIPSSQHSVFSGGKTEPRQSPAWRQQQSGTGRTQRSRHGECASLTGYVLSIASASRVSRHLPLSRQSEPRDESGHSTSRGVYPTLSST